MNDNLGPRPKRKPLLALALWVVALGLVGGAISLLRMAKVRMEERRSGYGAVSSIERIRQPVERCSDVDAATIDPKPKPTTLAAIKSLVRPASINFRRSNFARRRVPGFETTIWSFEATITEAVFRSDGDLYLVVEAEGARGSVEVPDPSLCVGSPYQARIANVRTEILRELGGRMPNYHLSVKARLTGVGFFGTEGASDNGARLEPLLGVEWLPQHSIPVPAG